MKKRLLFSGLLACCFAPLLFSQTSYTDDFSGTLNETIWANYPGYSHSIVDEQLVIAASTRNTPSSNQSFRIDFSDAPIDIKDNPVLNFKIRLDKATKLDLWFNLGKIYATRLSVPETDFMVPMSLDLSMLGPDFDLTSLKYIDIWIGKETPGYSGQVYIDDFVVGDGAVAHANIGGIRVPTIYAGSTDNKIIFKDIDHAESITVSGADAYLENVRVSPIVPSTFSNIAYVTFDVKDGVSGTGEVTVTAVGAGDYADNPLTFDMDIVTNMAPEIDQPDAVELEVGQTRQIRISGISDGDEYLDQEVSISATSSNPSVIADGDISIEYSNGSPYATLNVLSSSAGIAEITVTVDDGQDANNTTSVVLSTESWNNLNLPPTIDGVSDQIPYADATDKTILLTGISDGNGGTQGLNFVLASSDQSVIEDASLSVTDVNIAEGTAILHYSPIAAGEAIISVTVADDAAGSDNPSKEVSTEIVVKPAGVYATGHDWSLCKDEGRWGGDSGIEVEAVQFDGGDALKVTCTDKWMWGALNFSFSDTSLNLSEHPYVSLEVYSEDVNTLHWLWFYDDWEVNNDGAHRNDFPDVTHDEGKARWAEAGKWTEIVFDFSGENEMSRNVNEEPVPINAKRIVRILYNFHDKESVWPLPPSFTGTFYIRNFKVGDKANAPDPFTTIDPVADQVSYVNPGAQTITVTGLSDGRDGLPDVSIESLNSGYVNPSLGTVQTDGTAEVSFDPGAAEGEAKIVLTVSAAGSQTVTDTFLIKTIAKDVGSASGVTIDMSERHQVMRGIGTYMNKNFDLYTREMGASAMRVGIISNQIEWSNDNNDPYVLNREGLDYSAFDWDAMRKMKEMGVETFILTSWSAPAWMKDNHDESWVRAGVVPWENAPNRTSPFYYDEWAEMFVAAYRMFEEEAGIKLAGFGIQNEPAFYEPYPSAILSPEEFAKMIVVLGKRLEEEGIDAKLYMPEQVFSQSNYSIAQYISAVIADPEADKYCEVVGVHGYASDGIGAGQPDFSAWATMYNQAQAGAYPKEMWMTETHKGYSDYSDAMWIAMAIYGGMEYGNMGLWTQWGIVGQHIINGEATQMLYTVGNYARFIKPGAVRVTSTSDNADLFSTAWVNDEEGRLSVVLINDSNAPISTVVNGTDVPDVFDIYLTTVNRQLDHMGTTTDGLVVVPPQSVMTLVATGNAAPTIDPVDDQMVAYNGGQQSVTLTGIDPVEGGQSIVSVVAESDNTILIPTPTVGTLQPDGSAALTFTPASGQSGTATISVTVTDDGPAFVSNATTMQFQVMVFDQYNNKPVVERINDQYVMEDAQGTIAVGVTSSDGDDGSQTLTGAAVTDNADLVTGLTYNNSTHEVEFSVAPDKHGEATITVTINDDGGSGANNGNQSATRDFKVYVASVNDAPSIDPIDNKDVGMNAAEQVISLTGLGMGDTFGDAQDLSLWATSSDATLITPPIVEYYGGATASLKFTPIRNKLGSVDVTVYVEDDGSLINGGVNLTTVTFTVNIVATDVNYAPSMTAIPDTTLILEDGALTIDIEGVDDGNDDEDQTITITATSENEGVVAAPTVNWVPSLGIGSIKLTPVAEGTSLITVTVKDDGGTEYGGVDTQEYTFTATVRSGVGFNDDLAGRIVVYPNPAVSEVTLEFNATEETSELTVTDLTGKIRIQKQVEVGMDQYRLDLGTLESGMYIIRIGSGEHTVRSTIIKQ